MGSPSTNVHETWPDAALAELCVERPAAPAAVNGATFWALSGEPSAVVACEPTDTVASLRQALQAHTGEGGRWRLRLGSRVLGGREMLLDVGIGDGTAVHVVRSRPVMVVSGSDDGTAKLWSSTSGECLGTLEGHGGTVNSASFSPV